MSDANSKKGRRGGNSPEDQRKEQNRIISELKMIRLLQTRVTQNTTDVDAQAGQRSAYGGSAQAHRGARRPARRHSRRHRTTGHRARRRNSRNPSTHTTLSEPIFTHFRINDPNGRDHDMNTRRFGKSVGSGDRRLLVLLGRLRPGRRKKKTSWTRWAT